MHRSPELLATFACLVQCSAVGCAGESPDRAADGGTVVGADGAVTTDGAAVSDGTLSSDGAITSADTASRDAVSETGDGESQGGDAGCVPAELASPACNGTQTCNSDPVNDSMTRDFTVSGAQITFFQNVNGLTLVGTYDRQ